MTKSISELQAEITAWGASKGWDKPALCNVRARSKPDSDGQYEPAGVNTEAVLAKLALVHSEVSEAVEAARDGKYVAYLKNGKPEGVVVELADTMIRIMHLAGLLGLDLESAVEMKMAYNAKREYRHGGKLA